MTQEEFITNFVLIYPRIYVGMVSCHFSISEENLDRYGHVFSWNVYGISGNINIEWTEGMKVNHSSRLLPNYQPTVTKIDERVRNFTVRLTDNPSKKTSIKNSEITETSIKYYKEYIQDWDILIGRYSKVDFDFLNEYREKIKVRWVLSNPCVCWEDLRLFTLGFKSVDILTNANIWKNFVEKYVDNNTLVNHLEALNQLDKFIQINWKSERSKNYFKYLLSIYITSPDGHVMITSGYYHTPNDYSVGTQFPIDKKQKYPIMTGYDFGFKRS